MSAQQSTNGFSQRSRRRVLAVLCGIGLLGIPAAQGHAHSIDGGVAVIVSRDRPAAQPPSGWGQLPIESRELWKFRLTRDR